MKIIRVNKCVSIPMVRSPVNVTLAMSYKTIDHLVKVYESSVKLHAIRCACHFPDIDECFEAAVALSDLCVNISGSQCVNTEGSFDCACVPGYFLNDDGVCESAFEDKIILFMVSIITVTLHDVLFLY